jgi:hypothetical protein
LDGALVGVQQSPDSFEMFFGFEHGIVSAPGLGCSKVVEFVLEIFDLLADVFGDFFVVAHPRV